MVPRLFQSTKLIQQGGLKFANMLAGHTVRDVFQKLPTALQPLFDYRFIPLGIHRSYDDQNGERFNLGLFRHRRCRD